MGWVPNFSNFVEEILKKITEMQMNINELFSQAVEERAREIAAEIVAAQKKPQIPADIGRNGESITPYLFAGEKYLSCQQVEALLGVKYSALWKMKKRGDLPYRKVGNRILFRYSDVENFVKGEGGAA